MDARIILGVQPIDVVGAMRQGNSAAVETNAIRQQNALADLYRTQGQGLMRGNPQSLNALARLDPVQAQNMSISQQELDIKYAEAKRQAAEAARTLDDQQRQAQAAELDRILSGAAALYAKGDQAGYTAWLQQNKVDPAQYPFEMFPAHAATVKGAMDALKEFTPKPVEAPAWRQATPQEAAGYGASGGQINSKTGEFKAINPPSGMSLQTNPDGTMTLRQGPGATSAKPDVGDAISPAGIDEAKNLISDLLKTDDKVMSRITGSIAGGGGNNVDELPAYQRAYYGEQGLATIEKLGQLGSQAWFAARDMLKGGGQITDYESRKAEAAVARLSRTKDPKELKSALQELLDAINAGQKKLQDAGKMSPQEAGQPAAPETGLTADDLKYLEMP